MNRSEKDSPYARPPVASGSSADRSRGVAGSGVPRTSSCVAPGLRIEGEITGPDDLQVDGSVDGSISIPGRRLTVGPAGQLSCTVEAREVVVFGTVVGNLHATELIDIRKDASVVGDICAARISIEDGARFQGRVDMEKHPAGE